MPRTHRLPQHFVGVGAGCIPAKLLGRVCCNQNARRDSVEGLQNPNRLQTRQLGHVHIEQCNVDRLAFDNGNRLFSRFNFQSIEVRFEDELDRLAKPAVIVSNQQLIGFWALSNHAGQIEKRFLG